MAEKEMSTAEAIAIFVIFFGLIATLIIVPLHAITAPVMEIVLGNNTTTVDGIFAYYINYTNSRLNTVTVFKIPKSIGPYSIKPRVVIIDGATYHGIPETASAFTIDGETFRVHMTTIRYLKALYLRIKYYMCEPRDRSTIVIDTTGTYTLFTFTAACEHPVFFHSGLTFAGVTTVYNIFGSAVEYYARRG